MKINAARSTEDEGAARVPEGDPVDGDEQRANEEQEEEDDEEEDDDDQSDSEGALYF